MSGGAWEHFAASAPNSYRLLSHELSSPQKRRNRDTAPPFKTTQANRTLLS